MSLVNVSTDDAIAADMRIVQVNNTQLYYGEFVHNLVKEMGSSTQNILHAAVGISGEAGELLDAVKKHWAYDKPLDRANVIEELGDLEFYTAALRMLIGASRTEVLSANVAKLSVRYASGSYSNEQAQARADKGYLAPVQAAKSTYMGGIDCSVCNNDIKVCATMFACPVNSLAQGYTAAAKNEAVVLSQQQVDSADEMAKYSTASPTYESKLKEQRMAAVGELPPIYY